MTERERKREIHQENVNMKIWRGLEENSRGHSEFLFKKCCLSKKKKKKSCLSHAFKGTEDNAVWKNTELNNFESGSKLGELDSVEQFLNNWLISFI